MANITEDSHSIDCRGAGFGANLKYVNIVDVTKVRSETGRLLKVEVACSHLTTTKVCSITGGLCHILQPVTSFHK